MKSNHGPCLARLSSRCVRVLSICLLLLLAACQGLTANDQPTNSADSTNNANSASSSGGADSSSSAVTPSLTSQTHWVLTWDDEFNGYGVPEKWSFDTGGYGFGNKQLEYNTSSNATLNGHGQLVIAAQKGSGGYSCWNGPCEYTSARIETLGTFSQAYGRFEVRMKLPPGRGLWPAFWLAGAKCASNGSGSCGELDVIEVAGRNPYLVRGYAHAPGLTFRATDVLYDPIYSSFHVFGLDWTPRGITWTLDGKPYATLKAYPGWPFNHPMYMILDLAVGGNWPGPPSSSTQFPASMLVDWVRVYRGITS